MTEKMQAQQLAAGPGWHVDDLVCTAGPHDAPFEERHGTIAIAIVTSGSFAYRTSQGAALMVPGAVLLGNHGRCFECGHEHGVGDRCLSFHFAPDYWEDVTAAVPGVRRADFPVPVLPPVAALQPVAAVLEAARDIGRPAMEEVALTLAGAVLQLAASVAPRQLRPRARDERRIQAAVRYIERAAHDAEEGDLSLAALAAEAGMSRFHFLRTFRSLVGTTPHQYVMRQRLHRAAVDLRTTDDPVTTIAFRAGFGDLSTFCRRFRGVMGASPAAYRRLATH